MMTGILLRGDGCSPYTIETHVQYVTTVLKPAMMEVQLPVMAVQQHVPLKMVTSVLAARQCVHQCAGMVSMLKLILAVMMEILSPAMVVLHRVLLKMVTPVLAAHQCVQQSAATGS
jgi:hypothetical protein